MSVSGQSQTDKKAVLLSLCLREKDLTRLCFLFGPWDDKRVDQWFGLVWFSLVSEVADQLQGFVSTPVTPTEWTNKWQNKWEFVLKYVYPIYLYYMLYFCASFEISKFHLSDQLGCLSAPSYAVFVCLLKFVKLLRLRRFLSCLCNKKRNPSYFVGGVKSNLIECFVEQTHKTDEVLNVDLSVWHFGPWSRCFSITEIVLDTNLLRRRRRSSCQGAPPAAPWPSSPSSRSSCRWAPVESSCLSPGRSPARWVAASRYWS